MKIIFTEKKKRDADAFKKKTAIIIECLLLAFVMSVFTVFLMLENIRSISVKDEYQEVDSNILFEIIELNADRENKSLEKGKMTYQVVDFQ